MLTFLAKNLVITISLRIFARKNNYYGDPFKETSHIDIADEHWYRPRNHEVCELGEAACIHTWFARRRQDNADETVYQAEVWGECWRGVILPDGQHVLCQSYADGSG